MSELARGSVTDRPWGRTFATLALRGLTGQLTLEADGKLFLVAFEHGAIVAASSPLASDAAVRVALTGHLVSSSQVPEISRRLADAPARDEVDVIAELARLGPDHALRLRRRVIAQRAARTFSINHGEFSVTDDIELAIMPGCELDVRAVVYMGARANLSEQRLAAELEVLGSWFQLKPEVDEDLPQFGFSDVEQPVIERLRDGGTIDDIEAFASSFVDGRTVRAVVYALASYNACEVAAARAGAMPTASSPTTQPPGTQPQLRSTQPPAMAQPRASTQPMPRTLTRPAAPEASRAPRPTPEGSRPLRPTPVPGSHPAPASRTVTPPPGSPTPPRTTSPSGRSPAPIVPRSATPPGGRNPIVTSTGSMPTLTPPADPLDDGLDPPTQRDAIAAGSFPDPAHIREPRSSAGLRLPLDEAPREPRSTPGMRAPVDVPREMRSSPGLHLPLDEAPREARSTPGLHPPLDDPREMRARPALEDPRREPEAIGRGTRDLRSTPGSRPPIEEPREMRSSPGLRLPLDEAPREARSTPGLRPPVDEAPREARSTPGLRPPLDEAPREARSTPALRVPSDDAGPELVLRRVASRPAPTRQVARSDTPQTHEVKALIAQRLKLLDHGADHFQLLGVGPDAPPDAVRRAYFLVARQLHPDRLAALGISDDGKHAQRLFAQINAGFAVLSNPSRRAHYLDILRRGGEAAVRAEQAKAEELARRILEAEEAFRRAELALRRDQPGAAVGELELATQLNPEETDYQALLAWAQFCAAPDKVAIATRTRTLLDRAIQRSPRSVTARFYLGRVERMLGSDKDALRHFRDVLAQAPGHAEAAAEVRVLEARMLGGDKPGGGLFGRNKR